MAFLVTKTTGNGYRCGCCSRSSNSEEWFDDRAEALAQVPTTPESSSYFELESVEVVDGADRKVIARGELQTLSYQRGDAYRNQRWTGHVDGVEFDEQKTEVPGETWAEAGERLRKKRADADLEKAQAELERAQKALAAAKVGQ
jgi:hypothetical protein